MALAFWFLLLRLAGADQPVISSGSDGPKKEVLVREQMIDSALADIVYLGKKHESVLVTSKSRRLYRSKDMGQSWTEITDKIDTGPMQELRVKRIITSSDNEVVVLETKRRMRAQDGSAKPGAKWWPYIYVSEDAGSTWRKAWGHHHGLHSWISHPTRRNWALVSWWAGDCEKVQGAAPKDKVKDEEDEPEDQEPCVHRLMMTTNLGKTFVQIATYVVQFSWGSKGSGHEDRAYLTSYRKQTGDQGRLSRWSTEVDLHYVDFNARGRPVAGKELLTHGNKFAASASFLLVAKVHDEAAQTVHLMVSTDGGKTFEAAMLPSGLGELEEKWYSILDTSEGAVILHIDSEENEDTGRIFLSDSKGVKYAQSLAGNVRSEGGDCEFDKVVSLEGVYIANIQPSPGGVTEDTFEEEAEQEEEAAEEAAFKGAATDKKDAGSHVKKAGKDEKAVRTVISFDKGGAWSYLKPPRVDSLGQPYECTGKPAEECALHLHGPGSSREFYAPFYSTESSAGIIMGTGNVGASLRYEPGETCTFLSRDGGLTWMEAHKGSYIYEFGDHGGLILMADVLKRTAEVVFTWNEGQTWFDFKVSNTPFDVDNIIIEPNTTATTFLMYGTREEGVGVLNYMQFDSLQFPACTGVWAADSVSSDYETWRPSDGVSDDCLLGQKITYTRRKRTSSCWNGVQFERPVIKEKCACTKEDFECEVGFVRAVGSMDCVYGGDEMMPPKLVPEVCRSNWEAEAYRKVPGDMCEGGFVPVKAQIPCPSLLGVKSSTTWGFLVVVGVLGYLGYTKVQNGKASQMHPGMMQGGGRFAGLAVACCSWIGGKLASNKGFEGFSGVGYSKVQGDELGFDASANEESLTDFIDEADYDDRTPHAYGAEDYTTQSSGPQIVDGGARAATTSVPRLQAPPGGSRSQPQHLNATADDDDDSLL